MKPIFNLVLVRPLLIQVKFLFGVCGTIFFYPLDGNTQIYQPVGKI